MPRRDSRVFLEGVMPFAAAGVLFGLLYNALFYPPTPVEFLEAGTIGLLLGIVIGIAEQTGLERWLRRHSFLQAIAIRTVSYALYVAFALALVLSVEPATMGECAYIDCVGDFVASPLFLRDLAYSTGFTFLAAFAGQIVLLVGARNFGRLLMGKYRSPREINAVFMFVDVRGSTTIAERLGHEKYSEFLRDFFNDVSGAIHQAKGEVYQYVGDEVILVWPGDPHEALWLGCFRSMREAIGSLAPVYQEKFGTVPEFKAGVHGGKVIVTEVGTLQRAHVYHGDVVNTTSRIQAKCKETGFDLLASEEAVSTQPSAEIGRFERIGPLPLKGKSEEVVVFGLRLDSRAA